MSELHSIETVMERAFKRAGVVKGETPQKAAERIWKETKHDPVETMVGFDEWARENPNRMLEVISKRVWCRAVRAFLERHDSPSASRIGPAFHQAMVRRDRAFSNGKTRVSKGKMRANWTTEERLSYHTKEAQQKKLRKDRIKNGIKVVRAEVDVKTGAVVNLIDKEYGPFAHISVNGLKLPHVTTEQALRYCDEKTKDVKFVRALCHLIPDPRKPIGEQWDADMIRKAKKIASAPSSRRKKG